MTLLNNPAIALIGAVADAIVQNKDFLTSLDAAIGDADHGINLSRGVEAVRAKAAASPNADIGALLKMVGMTLISTVGGASGPLYGTAFLRAAAPAQGKRALDGETVKEMLAAAIQGIKDRGKATRGEKTMLDALEPAFEAFVQGLEAQKPLVECLEAATAAARQGVEFTKTIVATKGRASYLGERSKGHQDPGATSAAIMLAAITDFCRKAP
ncbi:dihydroxyacetone kinase, l subunit [Heliomicrobium modesticaldum Ice1]|uniref:phosphoenolpyruvate--glycerone phosphotransferase n=1 Tax=Heliobacterium modesticaldum (strain ATCC 51547 / Ice1) TaxID=498761 RepID=B0TAR9_HELMI|nr:dihydroxyacetone kinase, l subunit [Heliomicrobium modesticaldum Ice1]